MRYIFLFSILFSVLPFASQAGEPTTILLFGDSIVAGYGLKEEETIPNKLESSLLESGINVNVINGGVSGDTTASGRNRLSWTLKEYEPDIVLLALGSNDMLRGLPPEITRENIDAMLKELTTGKNRRVILSSVIAPDNLGKDYREAFARIYPELAKKYKVPLYPFLLENIYGKHELILSDGMHPNVKGAYIIADSLADYIRLHYFTPAS